MDLIRGAAMGLILGVLWSVGMARVPPAFERIEASIWAAFLDGQGDSFDGFYYNVKLGEDRYTTEQLKDPLIQMQQDLALKRIDAVGRRKDIWDLIEVRRHAGPGSIGQLLTYETLWQTYAPDKRPYTLSIVTDYMDIDTQLAARARGVTVFVV